METPASPITRTVTVVFAGRCVAHYKNKGSDWRNCKCRKSVLIYDGGRQSRVSAKTRSWAQAEDYAQKLRDKWLRRCAKRIGKGAASTPTHAARYLCCLEFTAWRTTARCVQNFGPRQSRDNCQGVFAVG
jgi:hypothetical protein